MHFVSSGLVPILVRSLRLKVSVGPLNSTEGNGSKSTVTSFASVGLLVMPVRHRAAPEATRTPFLNNSARRSNLVPMCRMPWIFASSTAVRYCLSLSPESKRMESQEVEHLGVPVIGARWPAMMKDDGLRVLRAPVLLVNRHAVLRGNRAHSSLLCEASAALR